MKKNEFFENGIFTVRFIGSTFDSRGVSIYDFGTILLTLQRIINKAHLSMKEQLRKGAFPDRKDREMLSLQIGERRRQSDAFALVPILTDPTTIGYLKKIADYVASGIVGYYTGDVIKRLSKESDENKQIFIGSIHADIVNIVSRIDASGGIENIEIGSPATGKDVIAHFDSKSKEYVNELANEFYLGRKQEIKGNVYRLYPNSFIVTIRRAGGRKVNISLKQEDFEKVRYYTGVDPLVTFYGYPRYKMGVESNIIDDFEADSIKIEEQG